MTPATERLAASRERLRLALARPGKDGHGGSSEPMFETLARAWAMPRLNLAADVLRGLLVPVIQHRPITVVLVAAAAGALVVGLKPWRGLLRPALLAGALPLLAKAVLRMPPGMWSQVLAQLSKKA